MYSRLLLGRFGRFNKVEIPLAKATVVHGGNESGKTTVLDALVSATSAQEDASAAVARHYGPEACAILEGEGGRLPHADVAGLLIARDGELRFGLDACDDESWRGQLEARLKACTLDVAGLAAELSHQASDDPALAHNQALRALEERSVALRGRIERFEAATRGGRELDAEERALDAAQAELQGEMGRAEAALARDLETLRLRHEAEARARELVVEQLAALRAHAEDLAIVQDTPAVPESDLADIERLHVEVTERTGELVALDGRRGDCAARRQGLSERFESIRAREPAARQLAARAGLAATRLRQALAKPPLKERKEWLASRLGLAGAAWLVALAPGGIALFGVEAPSALWLAGVAVGLVVGAGALLSARRVQRVPDLEPVLAAARAEWVALQSSPALPPGGPAEVLAFLDGLVKEHGALVRELEQHVTPKLRHEEGLAVILERSRGMLDTALSSRRQAYEAALALHRVADRDQLIVGVARRREAEARIAERLARGEVPAEPKARQRLREELDARLASPTLLPPATDLPSEDGVARTQAELERLRQAIDAGEVRAASMKSRRSLIEEECGASLADVPVNLSAAAAERLEVERELESRRGAKQSAAALGAVYAEMARRPQLHLELLAQEVTTALRDAGLGGIEVRLEALSEAGLLVSDQSGAPRPVRQLSAGRRDLAVLAARLVLAEKLLAGGGSKVVVLEDSWARLGSEWQVHAWRLLAAFQERTGWQMVLITRHAEQARALSAELRDATLVDLAMVEDSEATVAAAA